MDYFNEMHQTCETICQPGKGILAADESTGTIGKRFSTINVVNNELNRHRYRELLFTTPNLEKNISGVITYEETLMKKLPDGSKLIQPLLDKNIVVGIKTDKGAVELDGTNGETVTQGIDGMKQRCQEYYNMGARFAKWRAVLRINSEKNHPSEQSISANAYTLARYASISQSCGLVPIVEPEILMDGHHTFEESYHTSVRVLHAVYNELVKQNVRLDCTLLKPNMVRCGVESDEPFSAEKIGEYTIKALRDGVPVSVPGIVFLSGGMSEMEASLALNMINKMKQDSPWRLTFSYGRALQASVLKAWCGNDLNVTTAQEVLLKVAERNGMASDGMLVAELPCDNQSLHEKNYSY